MDKEFAVRKAGSQAALARLLGKTRQAVHQWRDIPTLRLYLLRELRPTWFVEFEAEKRGKK